MKTKNKKKDQVIFPVKKKKEKGMKNEERIVWHRKSS